MHIVLKFKMFRIYLSCQSLSHGRVKNISLSMESRLAVVSTQPPIQWVLWVKQIHHEAGHSPLTTATVKETWVCTSISPYIFIAQCILCTMIILPLIMINNNNDGKSQTDIITYGINMASKMK
jgi:hypothetical protein